MEHGNLPEFAQGEPGAFWLAADLYERANGRTYTEIQAALPRELTAEERNEVAREATRELLGDRFPYTLTAHNSVALDNVEQPYMHLMFSTRPVTEHTRKIEKERFFKRNGAKKDTAWQNRDKPKEVREKWVEVLNAAMERAGHEQRLDARSYEDRGRYDLVELREPKLREDNNHVEMTSLHTKVSKLRRDRATSPAEYLNREEAISEIELEAQIAITRIERRAAKELMLLDRLIKTTRGTS